jgi:histidine triad (HIT) family protein
MDCIFCNITNGEVPASVVYTDDEVIAFRDVNPVAPTHILIIPRRHIATLNDLDETDLPMVARMMKVATNLARQEGISEKGYRLVMNCGREGTQLVQHLHMHLIGGRQLSGRIG